MSRQYHIQLDEGECAPYVLLPGDPGRVAAIAATWDTCEQMASNREYVSYRGTYKGVPISCTSTGIGGPSTAIALEELARVGAKVFLRVGTCGAFRKQVRNGDLVIFDSAARFDGASRSYAPLEYPAVAHHEVVQACIEAAKGLGIRYHVGCTRTHDGLYSRHPEPEASFNNYWQSQWKEHYRDLERLDILASDMETAVVLVLAKIWGLRAGSLAVSVINMLHTDAGDEYDPTKDFDTSEDTILTLARILYDKDQEQYDIQKLYKS
jgi:uridine phosphorylase